MIINKSYLAVAISLLSVSLSSYAAKDPELQEYENTLTQQLNQCRSEYKSEVSEFDAKISQCKAKYKYESLIRDQCGTLIWQSQYSIDQKAKACKKIKSDLNNAPQIIAQRQAARAKAAAEAQAEKKRIEEYLNADLGKKIGPSLRCYRLGQNLHEFSYCSKELGFSHDQIVYDPNGIFGFSYTAQDLMQGRSVVAYCDPESHRIARIDLSGPSFFGIGIIDEDFIKAYMKKYDIPSLRNGTYSNHEEGWRITFGDLGVTLERIQSRQDYKF